MAVRMRDLAMRFDDSTAATADLHVGGAEFFPRILDDIAAATSSVHIDQYGFRPGAIGERFAAVLLAKAAEGIPVRLVVDGSGSYRGKSGRAFYERLRDGGIEWRVVRATSPRHPAQLGHFDHRKFVVVDGRVGWIGGAGIEDHFEDGRFHDMFLRVSGPVVSQLQDVFTASFRWLGGVVPEAGHAALYPPQDDVAGAVPARVLHNAPGSYRPIADEIARMLDGARETLDVVNPYVTDRRMIGRIEAAARRGVRVRLFVPAKANNRACAAAQLSHHADLLVVRDGEEVLIGTCNLDGWSLKRFFEIDVLVRSAALAEQFEERFVAHAEAACTAGSPPAGWRARGEAALFGALSPLL
jgi:cardiolipin synthase A/B